MTLKNDPVFEVWYQRIWGTLHIALGCVFSAIFILGALVLEDLSTLLYLVLSGLLIYKGVVRLRKPYLIYTRTKIVVYGAFGELFRTYEWEHPDDLMVRAARFYLRGKKLQFNAWFTNRHQYKHMLDYFSEDSSAGDELVG